jgi:4-hydroxy-4-methyl-2-oxoglutarate aldolase
MLRPARIGRRNAARARPCYTARARGSGERREEEGMAASPEDGRLLELFGDLRVADVRDGMDWCSMHGFGSMDPGIRPLFRVRSVGIARTCRYLPFEGPIPRPPAEEYRQWSDWYYGNVCTYPWMDDIREGDFIVIDQSDVDAGLMGSANGLAGFNKGARGFVTNGGVRDTDELIAEKVPFWSRMVSKSMVQARLRFDGKDVPVCVGGIPVRPGDVVVADGDGVIVVPRGMAIEVAKYAAQELSSDKVVRRRLYAEAGLAPDGTVR